jgi:hypothetical protein
LLRNEKERKKHPKTPRPEQLLVYYLYREISENFVKPG